MSELLSKIGSISFIVGVVIAILIGLFAELTVMFSVTLVVLGFVVGFLNISENETMNFLAAVITLILIAGFGGNLLGTLPVIGEKLLGVFLGLLTFIIPAAMVVALKTIYSAANEF